MRAAVGGTGAMGPSRIATHHALGAADRQCARQSGAARHFDRRLGRERHSCGTVERLSSGQAMTGRSMRLLRLALAVLAGSIFAVPLHAQIGEQPIRIIFPFAPGGSGDTVARLIANKMSGALNRPVIVENRTGADGRIGIKMVKDAAPDGSTLLLTPIAPLAIYQHFYTHLDYDRIADFAPLSQLGTFDFGIAVGPQTDAKTLKDLVDWAKANPADANYAIPGAGTLPHFLGVMFGRAAKIDL